MLGVLIGQLIGRWGNFVNAEAYGQTVENWLFGMSINGDLTVHPIFLYESLWNLAGFILLHFLSKKRRFYGQTFLSYVVWYGVGRGFIEGIRGGDTLMLFDSGLRVSQVYGYLSALVAFGILVYKLIFSDRGDTIELLSNDEIMRQNAIQEAKQTTSAASEEDSEKGEPEETESSDAENADTAENTPAEQTNQEEK